jgi:hypothetical protein
MAAFDGERYLRCLGEDLVLESRRTRPEPGPGFRSALTDAAAALVAVDALTVDQATTITRDYTGALAARGDEAALAGLLMRPAPGPSRGRPPEEIRAACCEHTMATPWGSVEVHYALFTSISVAVAITVKVDPGMPIPQQSQATLTDDRGGTVAASFNGGGGGSAYTGQLVAYQPLSPDTRWIGVNGNRVDLIDDGEDGIDVRIEDLPPSSPAQRHLWDVLSAGRGPMFHRGQPVRL